MKRDFDSSMENSDSKRFRPEEILGFGDRLITRLLMNRFEFSKLIGKGGQTIGHIRSATGVTVKGSNIDEDSRLVLLVGEYQGILHAFDMITEILNLNIPSDAGIISVCILLEHNKTGKVVGQKGTMMNSIQSRSGCMNVRIEKEPRQYSGVNLRKLTLEGVLSAVRRAHAMIHALYENDQGYQKQPYGMMNSNSYGQTSRSNDFHGQSNRNHRRGGEEESSVPFPILVDFGIPSETVRQLTDMKSYLSHNFGLNLKITKEGYYNSPAPSLDLTEKVSINTIIQARAEKSDDTQEFCFGIPTSCAGGVIGKGGSILKDLQAEFRVRVHVEREEYHGERLVVLSSLNGADALPNDDEKRSALNRCAAKIKGMVEQLEIAQEAGMKELAPEKVFETPLT